MVLGVGWSDMQVVGSVGSGPTVLEATSDQSVIVLGFPPQHMAEQVLATGSGPTLVDGLRVFQSRLAGPSRVAFHLPRGRRVTLTVEGLLAGCGGRRLSGVAQGRTGPRWSCPTG